MFDEKQFSIRLAELRIKKGVSARDMSISLGQSPSYINNIENGRNFPSMNAFFYMCDYLNITPEEFFMGENTNPVLVREITDNLKRLNDVQLLHVSELVKDLVKK